VFLSSLKGGKSRRLLLLPQGPKCEWLAQPRLRKARGMGGGESPPRKHENQTRKGTKLKHGSRCTQAYRGVAWRALQRVELGSPTLRTSETATTGLGSSAGRGVCAASAEGKKRTW